MSYSKGLSESFLKSYADKSPPWGEVGYITYKRTYARLIPELGRTEEWNETCERVCNGLIEIGALFTDKELESLYDHLFNLRGFVSGRALWQLGTDTVRKVGADSLQNCWHVVVNNPEAFCFTFNQLMLGGGVGFNVLPEHVYELPRVKHDVNIRRIDTPDCDFVVPDNREGWVELLRKVLDAFFVSGKDFTYNTSCIRAAGKPIKSFGGTASGSEGLVEGIEQISAIIRNRLHNKMRPIDCVDVMNIIGRVVVAGNVRRSSEIAIGDANDREFLNAKNWNLIKVPNWRAMSNNSVATDSIDSLPSEFWSGYHGDGEPYGLINLPLCQKYGRLADGPDYRPDYDVVGVNPCAEITLCNKEPCNLADIVLPNVRSLAEFQEIATLLYKSCKTIANVGFSDPETHDVVLKNRRLGIGITGYMASKKLTSAESLTTVYQTIEQADSEYSRITGSPTSIKLTTVKPSGTLSLLPYGISPGMHAAFNRYMIRRIRFSANDPLVETCRNHGYPVEPLLENDGSHNTNTMVVSFPMSMPKHVKCEEEVSVIQELEHQKHLQTYWADNSVSATHYFAKDELEDVKTWLSENYTGGVKTASFLLAQGHGFVQAPLEKISKDEYAEMVASVTPIKSIQDDEQRDLESSLECAGGSCPIK